MAGGSCRRGIAATDDPTGQVAESSEGADSQVAESSEGASGQVADSSEGASGQVPESSESADPADALERYNTTLFDMMRTNMAATGAHVAALMRAKSVPEAVALSDGHLRRQFDVMAEQGRELSRLAQSLTFAVLQPRKG